jgi:drug/metabolite transporter (DMT)-like permease
MKNRLQYIDKGVLMMLYASLSFAVMGGFAKVLTASMPPVEITFFRNLAGLILVGLTLYKVPLKQIGGKPLLLFFRGAMGFLALLAYFYIMAYIPLGEAVTYNKTSPIFVAIFAYLFLGEKLPVSGWLAVLIGFVGILFVAKPDGLRLDMYDLLGIFSGIGAALAYTSIRELRAYYDTRAIVLSFMGVGTLGPLVLMMIAPWVGGESGNILFAPFVMPQGTTWLLVIGVGIFATISQLFMTRAYEYTKAAIVGTVSYSNIIFATIIGVMLGDPMPDFWTFLGIALVIGAGLLVSWERR